MARIHPALSGCLFLIMSIGLGAQVEAQAQTDAAAADSGDGTSDEFLEVNLKDFFEFQDINFVNEIGRGKDPFFPESKRRKVQQESIEIKGEKSLLDLTYASSSLALQGINWAPESPLALINGVTFSENESRNIKMFNREVPIRCMRISRTAVLIKFVDQNEFRILELKKE